VVRDARVASAASERTAKSARIVTIVNNAWKNRASGPNVTIGARGVTARVANAGKLSIVPNATVIMPSHSAIPAHATSSRIRTRPLPSSRR
jgi:hypothetical protein